MPKRTQAFFAEQVIKKAELRMAGNLINFNFPDGSQLTILVEEKDKGNENNKTKE